MTSISAISPSPARLGNTSSNPGAQQPAEAANKRYKSASDAAHLGHAQSYNIGMADAGASTATAISDLANDMAQIKDKLNITG